jgi:type II secretory pathway pseudopilin PulG
MLFRSRLCGFGRLDVLLVVALLLVLGFMMIPSFSMRAASRRDAQRMEDMRRIESAIARYWTDHHTWPPAHESPDDDDWDVSTDGDFIPALREGGYLAEPSADPRNDAQYHYRYRVFPKGSFGCSAEGPTYVLGVRSFETLSGRKLGWGGFQCPERDFAREFAWVSGNSTPAR